MKYIAEVDGQEFATEILDEHHIRFGKEILEVDLAAVSGQPLYSLIVNGESYEGYVYPEERGWQVLLLGRAYSIIIEDEREKRLRSKETGSPDLGREFIMKSPMPGLVVSVPIIEDQIIDKGQILLILESMKMQNELKSPRSGVVTRVRVEAGERVEQHSAMMTVTG